MRAPGGTELLLFVAGIPGEAEKTEAHSTLVRWLFGPDAEVRWAVWRREHPLRASGRAGPADPTSPEEIPWHFPREVVESINLVCESASGAGKHVTLVDVDRAGIHQELVRLWVDADDVFPLLIRPDGARLEGIENFTPHEVRGFVSGP